jgi:hypothetical protein
MALNARLRGVMDWLLEGYPTGVPPKDYIPLVALLRRRLNDDEIRQIADEIAALAYEPGVTTNDIGVSITRLTDALPTPDDIARVEHHLSRHHWQLSPVEGSTPQG